MQETLVCRVVLKLQIDTPRGLMDKASVSEAELLFSPQIVGAHMCASQVPPGFLQITHHNKIQGQSARHSSSSPRRARHRSVTATFGSASQLHLFCVCHAQATQVKKMCLIALRAMAERQRFKELLTDTANLRYFIVVREHIDRCVRFLPSRLDLLWTLCFRLARIRHLRRFSDTALQRII